MSKIKNLLLIFTIMANCVPNDGTVASTNCQTVVRVGNKAIGLEAVMTAGVQKIWVNPTLEEIELLNKVIEQKGWYKGAAFVGGITVYVWSYGKGAIISTAGTMIGRIVEIISEFVIGGVVSGVFDVTQTGVKKNAEVTMADCAKLKIENGYITAEGNQELKPELQKLELPTKSVPNNAESSDEPNKAKSSTDQNDKKPKDSKPKKESSSSSKQDKSDSSDESKKSKEQIALETEVEELRKKVAANEGTATELKTLKVKLAAEENKYQGAVDHAKKMELEKMKMEVEAKREKAKKLIRNNDIDRKCDLNFVRIMFLHSALEQLKDDGKGNGVEIKLNSDNELLSIKVKGDWKNILTKWGVNCNDVKLKDGTKIELKLGELYLFKDLSDCFVYEIGEVLLDKITDCIIKSINTFKNIMNFNVFDVLKKCNESDFNNCKLEDITIETILSKIAFKYVTNFKPVESNMKEFLCFVFNKCYEKTKFYEGFDDVDKINVFDIVFSLCFGVFSYPDNWTF